jgi:hypothetical protein
MPPPEKPVDFCPTKDSAKQIPKIYELEDEDNFSFNSKELKLRCNESVSQELKCSVERYFN